MFRGDHNSNTRQVLNRYINCVKNFYLKNKKTLNILLIVIFCVGFFGFVRYCFAETPASSSNISGWSMLKGPFISMLGYMASLIVQVCGWILTTTIGAVIDIAKYNDFVNNEQIKDAWIIIRDMCNMFFILILLVIAFATILRVETYNAKKLLPKLIIMAVLINFSRTICGLLIDASQLVMLTFVNAFTNATGNFVSLLKVQDFLKLVEDNNSWYKADTVDLNTAVGGLIIAVLFIIISTITLLAILIVFVVRMVMLWIYVVLSPFAFLLSSFPEGQKYAARWWGEFIKYLINGPILAFFIWMALITMDKLPVKDFANTFAGASGSLEILTGGKFMHFIIAIGMLVGGLMVSQQIGGIGASWGANTVKGLADKGIGFVKNTAKKGALWGIKTGTTFTGRQFDKAQMGIQNVTLGKLIKDYTPKTMNYRMIREGWKRKRAKDMEKYETKYGPHGSSVWHDTFNNVLRLKTYGAIRKSRKRQVQDDTMAQRLGDENTIMQQRINNAGLNIKDKAELTKEMIKPEKKNEIVKKYIGKADLKLTKDEKQKWAEENYNQDLASFSWEGNDINATEEAISQSKKRITKLNDQRLFGLGLKNATRYELEYSKSGAKEKQEKGEREMMGRTDGQYFSIISEIMQAHSNKDADKMVEAFRILGKNNDLNESLKDSRMIHLMTKEGGILQDLARTMELSAEETKQLISDFNKNPVSPAYTQAMVQGMLKTTKLDDSLAARYAHEIGSISFAAGNSLAYAMSSGNAATGDYDFDKMEFVDGKLKASEDRIGAIIGKFANMESQAKMRTVHPDVFIKEAPDGSAAGLSEEGKEFVESLTGHDMGQISRLRLDVIRKIGGSKQALRDLKQLVQKLSDDGETNKAELVKYFTGYIYAKYHGKGLEDKGDIYKNAFNDIG